MPAPRQAPKHERNAPECLQGGHDRAATLGCAGIIVMLATIALFVAVVAMRQVVDSVEAEALSEERADGSKAGSNAVTIEDIKREVAREEWESGTWSVTTEDLEREYELGQAYPLNGKNAALDSDTTYGKGAGMVDLVTYDKATNVMIRHYGQLGPDGRVRWYAAETVLDEDGTPKVMPRD